MGLHISKASQLQDLGYIHMDDFRVQLHLGNFSKSSWTHTMQSNHVIHT